MSIDAILARQQEMFLAMMYKSQPWRRPVASDPEWVAILRRRIYIRDGGTHNWACFTAYIAGKAPVPALPARESVIATRTGDKSPYYWKLKGFGLTDLLQTLLREYGFEMNESVEGIELL